MFKLDAQFKKANIKSLLIYLILIVSTFIEIVAGLKVSTVPVFADGTQHVWITSYVKSTGQLPNQDITGIQPTNFSVPISIATPQPFIYSPLFYVLTGSLSTLGMSAATAVVIMNIIPPIFTGLFLYLLCRKLFSERVALLVFILVAMSSLWPWMTVHRLVEPTIILLFSALLYFFFMYSASSRQYLLLIAIFLAALLGTKQTVYPIVLGAILTIFITMSRNRSRLVIGIFIALAIPLIFYSMRVSHALTTTPIGINKIDKLFKNAWWNQQEQPWELNLDRESHVKALRQLTFAQFKQVQKSPANLYNYAGVSGVANEFSLYPLSSLSTEGYQSTVPGVLYLFFLLMITCGIVALFEPSWRQKLIKNGRITLIFLSLVLVAAVIFWFKQPVFRYYIYILLISVILLGLGFDFLLKKSGKSVKYFLILLLVILLTYNLLSEVKRDKNYVHTAMHQQIPGNIGGLYDSINFGHSISSSTGSHIFTPMVEIAYYSNKAQMWDDRLFFVDNKQQLIGYLKHYDFQYVVLPFYSGESPKTSWMYSEGIPSDSTFYSLLNDPKYFKIVEHNSTFTAYRKVVL